MATHRVRVESKKVNLGRIIVISSSRAAKVVPAVVQHISNIRCRVTDGNFPVRVLGDVVLDISGDGLNSSQYRALAGSLLADFLNTLIYGGTMAPTATLEITSFPEKNRRVFGKFLKASTTANVLAR